MNIIIADDHPIIAEGIKNILMEEPDIKVCCQVQDASGVLKSLALHRHDLLISDITMPGKTGIELLGDIKALYPKLPVLILSIHPADRYGVRAIKAGASGYMTKESIPKEIVAAVRKIVAGGRYITPALADQLAIVLESGHHQMPHEKLSDREFQILRSIASGRTIHDISIELNIAENTVKTYRSRLLEKMNLKSNVELTQYALRNKLIE